MAAISICTKALDLKGQDWPNNIIAIERAIDEAVNEKADILLLPELTLGGPGCADYARYTDNTITLVYLDHLAQYAQSKKPDLHISIGHFWRYANKAIKAEHGGSARSLSEYNRENLPFNAQSWIVNGDIKAMTFKTHLVAKDYSSRHTQGYIDGRAINISLANASSVIQIGSPKIMTIIKGEMIEIITIIGDESFQALVEGKMALPENNTFILLNPTASIPGIKTESDIKKQIDFLKTFKNCIAFATVDSLDNGGRVQHEGFEALAIRKDDGDFALTSTYPVDAGIDRELRNHAYWLFNYLRNSQHKSLTLAFSNDFPSMYTATKIRCIVELLVNEFKGSEIFLRKLNYDEKFIQEVNEIERLSSQIDLILSRFLVCVYARNPVLTHLEERIHASETLGECNMTSGCLGVTATNLDELCLNQTVLGGHLHSGQLACNQGTWRCEMLEHMEWWNQAETSVVFGKLNESIKAERDKQKNHRINHELTAKQTKFIFTYFLNRDIKLDRRPNPIEVYEKCRQEKIIFSGDSDDHILKKILDCYRLWGDAQINIHMAPISNNYQYKTVNHDYAQRTPNFNGFHRVECALLVLHAISPDLIKRYEQHVLTNEKLVNFLLSNPGVEPKNWEEWTKHSIFNPESISYFWQKNTNPNDIQFKIGVAANNQTSYDWNRNLKNIMASIDKACDDGASLLCLQELGVSGYGADDYFEYTDNAFTKKLLQIMAEYANMRNPDLILSVGHPWRLAQKENPLTTVLTTNKPFNVQSFIVNGEVVAMSAKNHLFNYERGYEKRYFEEWNEELVNQYGATKACIEINFSLHEGEEKKIPFGCPVITLKLGTKIVHLAHVICESAWVGTEHDNDNPANYDDNMISRLGNAYENLIIINPNSSPAGPGKISQYFDLANQALQKSGAEVYVHCNSLGTESSGITAVGSGFVAEKDLNGDVNIYSVLPVLSMKNVTYGSHIITLNTHSYKTSDQKEKAQVILDDYRPLDYQHLAHQNDKGPVFNIYCEDEMAIRTELLWLFDVMCKKGIHGFVQALSGGMDSAYNILKLRLMAAAAIQELGVEEFLNRLNYPEGSRRIILTKEKELKNNPSNAQEDIHEILVDEFMSFSSYCITLPSSNNGEETQHAARTFVLGGIKDGQEFKGIGGHFESRNIQPIMDGFLLSQTGIAQEKLNLLDDEKKKQLIEKLRLFASLRRDEIENIYNKVIGAQTSKFNWPQGVEDWSPAILADFKKTEEQRLRAALCAEFKKQIAEIFEMKGDDLLNDDKIKELIAGAVLSPIVAEHGLPLENKQARIRKEVVLAAQEVAKPYGLNLSAFSNPNKSEAANSYTTYSGDEHSGYYAPNAHIHKALQIRQMHYLARYGLSTTTKPIEALHDVLAIRATAELQPRSSVLQQTVQTDEDSMRRTYAEMEIITHEMLMQKADTVSHRYQTPIEVFDRCRSSQYKSVFGKTSIAELCDKLLETYGSAYWISAQHKIESSPIAMTYGGDIDHKISLQTPLLNAYHEPELTQFILHCLALLAEEHHAAFEALTGGLSLAFCKKYAMFDISFGQKLRADLWAEADAQLGCRRVMSLEYLYQQISRYNGDQWKTNFRDLSALALQYSGNPPKI